MVNLRCVKNMSPLCPRKQLLRSSSQMIWKTPREVSESGTLADWRHGAGGYILLGGRETNEDRCARFRGLFDGDAARMVLDNLADDCQPQSGPVGLAGAHEGIEKRIANAAGDSVTSVVHADLKSCGRVLGIHNDRTFGLDHRFTGIQDKVEKDALQLPGVKHALQFT